MGQTKGRRATTQKQTAPRDQRELLRLKLELVAARERGEHGALGRILLAHPQFVSELTQFAAGLVATSGYEQIVPTAATQAIAERAQARALGVLFPVAAPAPAPTAGGFGARVVASLKALRRAHGLSLAAAARRLGLGLDVVQNLEAGLIRASSVPERLTIALGDLLETTGEQIRAALDAQPVLRPALQRDRSASGADLPELDFAEAVRLSPSMSPEQKAQWLDD